MSNVEVADFPTMHERLRERTNSHHLAAEAALGMERSFASIQNYGALLLRLWGLHAAREQAIRRYDWARAGVRFEQRRRAHWLEEDILAIGLTLPPLPPLTHALGTIELAWGCLYVLEGSSLGAQLILKKALLLPGISRMRGARFFTGHGAATASLWKQFVSSLNGFDPRSAAAAQVELGALQTFDAFAAALAVPAAGTDTQAA
ncbi:MAG: biliverdin-producing heme oxygenase [Steroidobacteraceae bacterium]